ncbi:MAG: hypothetical protein AAF570_25435, partial [Bacteroidota bacterium]
GEDYPSSSGWSQRMARPARTAPTMGETQKSQSWLMYSPPAKKAGPEFEETARALDKHYIPNKLLVAAGKEEKKQLPLLEYRFIGGTKIFVCQNTMCKLPVDEVDAAVKLMAAE